MKKLLTRRGLAVVLTLMMSAMMFMATPAQAFADGATVTQDLADATYYQNDVPDDLVAVFSLNETSNGWEVNPDQPVYFVWQVSDDGTTWVQLGGNIPVTWDGYTEYSTSFTPPTDTVGVKYYRVYFVFTMESSGLGSVEFSLNSDEARIEVREFSATITIPFTKIVEQGGTAIPGETTFWIMPGFFAGMPDEGDGWEIVSNDVVTDGAGSYNDNLVISVTDYQVFGYLLQNGMVVGEYDGSLENWEYSDAVYYIAFELDDEEILVYFYEVTEIVDGNVYYDGAGVDAAIFTNVYTANTPVVPETPKTGDAGVVAIALAAACTVIGTGTVGVSRRRRNDEKE